MHVRGKEDLYFTEEDLLDMWVRMTSWNTGSPSAQKETSIIRDKTRYLIA